MTTRLRHGYLYRFPEGGPYDAACRLGGHWWGQQGWVARLLRRSQQCRSCTATRRWRGGRRGAT